MEYRFLGMRQAGRVLSGTAIRYGDVARIGGQREKFLPGSFPGVEGADVLLNRQHKRERPLARSQGGGLTVSDSPQALSIRAELPSTVDSDETLELVKSGVLRGLSIEFEALRESQENGTRVVTLAKLSRWLSWIAARTRRPRWKRDNVGVPTCRRKYRLASPCNAAVTVAPVTRCDSCPAHSLKA